MSDLTKFFKSLKRSENSRRGGIKGAEKTNVLQAPYLTPFKKEDKSGKETDSKKDQ